MNNVAYLRGSAPDVDRAVSRTGGDDSFIFRGGDTRKDAASSIHYNLLSLDTNIPDLHPSIRACRHRPVAAIEKHSVHDLELAG